MSVNSVDMQDASSVSSCFVFRLCYLENKYYVFKPRQ